MQDELHPANDELVLPLRPFVPATPLVATSPTGWDSCCRGRPMPDLAGQPALDLLRQRHHSGTP